MQATLEQLAQISVFVNLTASEWVDLQPHTQIRPYAQGEIVMQERDRLPTQLYALLSGDLQVTKMTLTGKETILRTLAAGEIFAAPALLGDGIAPATVTAVKNSLRSSAIRKLRSKSWWFLINGYSNCMKSCMDWSQSEPLSAWLD
jgi:CRP/FNR family transcriptional regulator, cyclic AMP receptor protein